MPVNSLMNIYNALVYSNLMQYIEIYSMARNNLLNRLQVRQNKILRTILNKKPREIHNSELYKSLKVLNISNLYKYQAYKFMYTWLNSGSFFYLNDEKTNFLRDTHVNTRDSNLLKLPQPKTELEKRCITYKSIKLWNSLPEHIKKLKNKKTFIKLIKKNIIENN